MICFIFCLTVSFCNTLYLNAVLDVNHCNRERVGCNCSYDDCLFYDCFCYSLCTCVP